MQDKARTFSFATKKTNYQVLIDDRWFLEWTDTVYVTGGYLEFFGELGASTSSQPYFLTYNFGDGCNWDLEADDRDVEGEDWDSFFVDTIVTIDTEGILSKTVN